MSAPGRICAAASAQERCAFPRHCRVHPFHIATHREARANVRLCRLSCATVDLKMGMPSMSFLHPSFLRLSASLLILSDRAVSYTCSGSLAPSPAIRRLGVMLRPLWRWGGSVAYAETAGRGGERFYTRESMARAWIVQWYRHWLDSPIRDCDLRPHILPRRWRSERVLDYMSCLFWNSALWTPFESLNRVNERKPPGIYAQNNGTRLLYGDATCLIAYPVKDLRIAPAVLGKVIMEWTTPANTTVDRATGSLVRVGEPSAKRYEWDNRHVSNQPPFPANNTF
jgi:hypothetical protein